LAEVWKLPIIFLIENNGCGLSTQTEEQFSCDDLVDRAPGYGLEGMKIDGNNIFEVIDAVSEARKNALNGNPTLIEAETFRMRGHEEAYGTYYVPDETLEKWSQKDTIHRFKEELFSKS